MKQILLLTISVLLIGATVGGTAHAETWRELLVKADSLQKTEQYDSALVLAKQALEITERQYGKEDTSVAHALERIGSVYYRQGIYREVEPYWRRSLDIRERTLGPNHSNVALTLNNLANLYCEQGRNAEAEPLFQRSAAILESNLGPDHPQVAATLANLAILFSDQGRYADAEPLCERALAIHEKTVGPDHLEVATSLGILAILYHRQGKYADAEPLYRRALAIEEKVLGSDHSSVAMILNNLACLSVDQGRYAEAEPLYRRALAIQEKALGPDHPRVAASLGNLATLYGYEGRHADAEPLEERALAIREKALGPDHPMVALSLFNLAASRYEQDRYAEAESFCERALAIQEKTLGPDHPDVATSLCHLASLYGKSGRYAEAEPLCQRALTIRERALGPDHPDVAGGLRHLARLYANQGRYADAKPLCRRAIGIRENALGPDHPNVAVALSDMALVCSRQGDHAAASDRVSHAWSIRRQNFRDGAGVMAERNALEYSQFLTQETGNYLAILVDFPDGPSVNSQEIARIVLSSKSQITDGMIARRRAIVEETNPDVMALLDTLNRARFALSDLYVTGPDNEHPESSKGKLQQATAEKERLEAELARRSASFARERVLWDVTAGRVLEALPAEAALVEFMLYRHRVNLEQSELRYLAVVLRPGREATLFPLGSDSVIGTAVLHYRQQFRDMQDLDRAAYATAAENLYSLVWRPFAALLSGASTVFIAPDGDLNLVSFAGLMDENGQCLIEKYPIHYLSTGRDLIRLQERLSSGSGFLAMGDPDFDMSYSMSTASAVGLALLTSLNLRSSCEALSKLNVPRLPSTRREVESVATSWRSAGAAAATYFGSDATEENFKQNAPGKKVIHLATHGFYISDECQKKLNTRSGSGMQEGGYVGENPLLLSGFLLAGANKHGEGATEAKREDGIVTAEEVAGLNLNGTDLVVLSACETGLGEVKSGEGVYGLRRAFQMAGARTVISALWPIDDKSTAEFMGQLFSAQDESLPQTMQRIALSRISALRSQGKSDHPFYWAAFVATGDWRAR